MGEGRWAKGGDLIREEVRASCKRWRYNHEQRERDHRVVWLDEWVEKNVEPQEENQERQNAHDEHAEDEKINQRAPSFHSLKSCDMSTAGTSG